MQEMIWLPFPLLNTSQYVLHQTYGIMSFYESLDSWWDKQSAELLQSSEEWNSRSNKRHNEGFRDPSASSGDPQWDGTCVALFWGLVWIASYTGRIRTSAVWHRRPRLRRGYVFFFSSSGWRQKLNAPKCKTQLSECERLSLRVQQRQQQQDYPRSALCRALRGSALLLPLKIEQ